MNIWLIGMVVAILSQMYHFAMTMVVCTITLPPPPITYSYVDFELPSGTKWATQNVGARKPSESGLYFQWGDTKGYAKDQVGKDKQFYWNDYKWNPSGDGETYTKYTTIGAKLELEDDAAHVNMGGSWHIPTPDQIKELINNTTHKSAAIDDVSGVMLTSKKDKSKTIFFPQTGMVWDGSVDFIESFGAVWSSMLSVDFVDSGRYFDISSILGDGFARCGGASIRGVIGQPTFVLN